MSGLENHKCLEEQISQLMVTSVIDCVRKCVRGWEDFVDDAGRAFFFLSLKIRAIVKSVTEVGGKAITQLQSTQPMATQIQYCWNIRSHHTTPRERRLFESASSHNGLPTK